MRESASAADADRTIRRAPKARGRSWIARRLAGRQQGREVRAVRKAGGVRQEGLVNEIGEIGEE